jgi:hypothetical protein
MKSLFWRVLMVTKPTAPTPPDQRHRRSSADRRTSRLCEKLLGGVSTTRWRQKDLQHRWNGGFMGFSLETNPEEWWFQLISWDLGSKHSYF